MIRDPQIANGTKGTPAIVLTGTAPTNTSVLWGDTSTSGTAVVPLGGSTGQVLAKTSATNYATTWADPAVGFRNVLINGDMRINQRGGSYTSVGYTLDRWYLGVTGAYTVSQSTSTPPTNFQNFMRVQRTSGSTNTGVPQIAQSLETSASIPLQGKKITVSFWARAGANYSAASNTLNWRIYGGTGTDQNIFSYTGQTTPIDQSVTLTTSWQRFTYTTAALTSYNEYALFFFTVPTGTAGANDYFDITGVQLEANNQPTPFEQRPIGVELSLCQRYYYKSGFVWGNVLGSGFISNGSNQFGENFNFSHPVTMRATPTLTYTFFNNDNAQLLSIGATASVVAFRETCAAPQYPYSSFSFDYVVQAEL